MTRLGKSNLEAVALAFELECITIPIANLLPIRALAPSIKSSQKYSQIAASIGEVGLVEPPVVARNTDQPGTYLLLDGHVRIDILKNLGFDDVECLIATDDEAFMLIAVEN